MMMTQSNPLMLKIRTPFILYAQIIVVSKIASTETTSVFIITLIHPINLMKYQTHIDIHRLTPNSLEL